MNETPGPRQTLDDILSDFNSAFFPGYLDGDINSSGEYFGGESILARDMLKSLARQMSPENYGEAAPLTIRDRYRSYTSTKEFCNCEFQEKYTPDIEEVMDSFDKHVITIVKSGNGVGKSHGAARIAVAAYKMNENVQVYTAAAPPESNLDMILWGQIRSLLAKYPEMFGDDNYGSSKYIGRKNDPLSYIIGLPIPQSVDSAQRKARFSGKHAPHLVFILDEGDAIPMDIYEAIESCMSGGFVRLVVMFNPRADVGPLSKMEKKKTGNVVALSALTHPNVVTGKNLFDGAVDRPTTVRRINEWTRPLFVHEVADSECFSVPEYLVGADSFSHGSIPYPPLAGGTRKITDPQFFYMVLARYPSLGENQLISAALIEAAVTRWEKRVEQFGSTPPGRTRPTMGVDVSEMGGDWTVVALKYGEMITIADRWQRKKIPETADLCAAHYLDSRVLYANIDANGVGAGVAPMMERLGCDNVHGLLMQSKPEMKSFSPEQAELGQFRRLRDFLWWGMKHWLENNPESMLPPDENLIEELKAATYSVENGNIVVSDTDFFREKISRSPDTATAVILANCHEFEEAVGEIVQYNYVFGDLPRKSWKEKTQPFRRFSERL